jgi:ABC-2 type transport system permease protein
MSATTATAPSSSKYGGIAVLNVERIKLFTTRSPWWCMITAALVTVGFAALFAVFLSNSAELSASIAGTQFGVSISQTVMMVMAALAVTTEYRFGTIRTSFQAIPQRSAMLVGKTVVVALLSALVGLVAAFGAWGVGSLIAGDADLAINTGAEWRLLAGQGVIFALSAVISVAIGILIRQSAGAIAILVLWPTAVELLLQAIPKIGDDLYKYAPFHNGAAFIDQGQAAIAEGQPTGDYAFGVWGSLLYFAAWAVGLLLIALFSASKRDA